MNVIAVPDVPLTIEVSDLTNEQFLETYAAPGRVGLVGGVGLLERMIQRSQRRQREDKTPSEWAHAFVFQGRRADGKHWVLESDLDVHRERAQLGVQENRISKYFDDALYDRFAVLDFGVPTDAAQRLLARGLDLLVDRTQYSVREIVALYLKLKTPSDRKTTNPLARDRAFFCSAFVQHVFLELGMDFAPDVDTKLTTPEDIIQTRIPHVAYVLRRPRLSE
jgi:hypothetical protein